ncbi:GNAT family N-acetyltransferase [Microbulbifer sp. MLAF003]|uniref:GNAT family N-acetyltransferase n=1 Tax=Microbulbifer TaxID=48073 RepID=UPI00036DCA5B|nr:MULTISPECIES: GNAT family N-acetyltransferase [Microbulbifer]WHI49355.1 GNAT family N-acetyltransferase [Microbulbifer sp. MLAF003]
MDTLIRPAEWNSERERIRAIREAVFVREQNVPMELEWDDQEESAQHFLVFRTGIPVGTGRLTTDGKIGRMAISKAARGLGLGAQLLIAICNHAKQHGYRKVYLHAQQHAKGFYAKAGFTTEGPVFYEAGIPHIKMLQEFGCPLQKS